MPPSSVPKMETTGVVPPPSAAAAAATTATPGTATTKQLASTDTTGAKKGKRRRGRPPQNISKKVRLSVTIVRHAETDMNAQPSRVLQGQIDTDINAFGKRQAEALSKRLRHQHFDTIYTSDLKRALQTTAEIQKNHTNTPVVQEKKLREKDLGDLTGLTWKEAKDLLKREDRHLEDHISEMGGESEESFKKRIVEFYGDLITKNLVQPHRQLMVELMPPGALPDGATPRTPFFAQAWAERQAAASAGVPHQSSLRQESRLESPDQTSAPVAEGGGPRASTATTGTNSGKPPALSVSTKSSDAALGVVKTHSPVLRSPSGSPIPHPSLAAEALAVRPPSSASLSSVSLDDSQQRYTSLSLLSCKKLKVKHILIVTHGGWIQEFMKYLVHELEFDVEENNWGFPRNTGVYQFDISLVTAKGVEDYEWIGGIVHMNNLGHMANIGKTLDPALAEGVVAGVNTGAKQGRTGSPNKKEGKAGQKSPSQSPSLTRKILYATTSVTTNSDPTKPHRSLGW